MAVEVVSGGSADFPDKFEEIERTFEKDGRIITCVERDLGSHIYATDRQRFFDTRELTIKLREKGARVQAEVNGKGRRETIDLTIGGLATPVSDPGILRMDRSLKAPNMYLLEALAQSEYGPLEHWHSVGIIRQNDSPAKKEVSEEHAKLVYRDALTQDEIPNRIVARLLTNDQHWQLVLLDLSEGIEKPRLIIVNTTNMIREMDLERIQEIYFDVIGQTINSVLESVGGTPIAPGEIVYMQGLQYGTMGCGFTSDLNYGRLLRGDLGAENVIQDSDFVKKESFETVQIGDETFQFPKTEVKLIKDRSLRVDRFTETFRRMEFYGELLKRDQLAREIRAYTIYQK
ncbi:MAG: hypothetical protein KDK64_03855 [Chlamydiia bacterium]|nr:hypothetical protein [Chlamydiia bacterium]